MSVDLNYHQRTPAHARVSFMQTLAYGASVQPHIQSVMGFEKSLLPVVRELFTCVEEVRPHLLDTELLPYIGVIDGGMQTAIAMCFSKNTCHLKSYPLIS